MQFYVFLVLYNRNDQIVFLNYYLSSTGGIFMEFPDFLFQVYGIVIIAFWPVVFIFFIYTVLKFIKLTKERNKYLSEISQELKKYNK